MGQYSRSSIEISQGMRCESAAFVRGRVENLRKTAILLKIDQGRSKMKWEK